MIKIYHAINNQGEIEIHKGIPFQHGRFNTGFGGYGEVLSGDPLCNRAVYSLHYLDSYIEYLEAILEKVRATDGFLDHEGGNSFIIYSPYDEADWNGYVSGFAKDEESFEEFGLQEEAIFLFTSHIMVEWDFSSNLIRHFFGRESNTAFFVLWPGAQLQLGCSHGKNTATYEALKSQSLSNELHLVKLDRM